MNLKYRIITSIVLLIILGGLYFAFHGPLDGPVPSSSTEKPAESSNDNSFSGLGK